MKKTQMRDALDRADKLVRWMSKHIGQMAPGSYHDCYADLNEHGLFMEALKRAEKAAGLAE